MRQIKEGEFWLFYRHGNIYYPLKLDEDQQHSLNCELEDIINENTEVITDKHLNGIKISELEDCDEQQ